MMMSTKAPLGKASAPVPCNVRMPVRCNVAAMGPDFGSDRLKVELVKAVSGTRRGKFATSRQRADIMDLVAQLESTNQQLHSALSPSLSGVWALLYQAPDEEKVQPGEGMPTEGPFMSVFQPLTKGLIRTKANLQHIDMPNNRIENLAEFVVADRWEGSLNIVGSGGISPPVEGQGVTRVLVEFEKFELRIGTLGPFTIPLGWLRPKGWVETTFLDGEMRVSRGDRGSVFVAARAKDSRWPGVHGSTN